VYLNYTCELIHFINNNSFQTNMINQSMEYAGLIWVLLE